MKNKVAQLDLGDKSFLEIVNFLKNLESNNSKEYMDANRGLYNQLRATWKAFTLHLINTIFEYDPKSVAFCEVGQAMFRINRDVRFSNNKQIYNTHFSVMVSCNGKKSKYAGYYVRINQDGIVTVGGGCHDMEANDTRIIRQKATGKGEIELEKIIHKCSLGNFYKDLLDGDGLKLKRCPSEFKKFEKNRFVYYKGFVLAGELTLKNKTVSDSNSLLNEIDLRLKELSPFIVWLNEALDKSE